MMSLWSDVVRRRSKDRRHGEKRRGHEKRRRMSHEVLWEKKQKIGGVVRRKKIGETRNTIPPF